MNTYQSYLKKLNKKQLTHIARMHHMPRYSTYKKEDLALDLEQFLCQPQVYGPFFNYLSSEEMNLLQRKEPSDDPFLCRRLVDGGYCFEIEPGAFAFPEDFELGDDWETGEDSFLLDCLEAAGLLYGSASLTILKTMYEKASGHTITEGAIAAFIMDLPDYLQHFSMVGDLVVHQSLMAGKLYVKIRQCQGAQTFYYPDAASIKHLARYGYLPDTHVDKMLTYMTGDLAIPLMKAREELALIQAVLRQGGTIEDVLNSLKKRYSKDYQDDTVYLSLCNELLAHTRLLLCRGYTAPEKQKQILHPTKIYPNSPCPCGSGKKYKKCCYKHR